MPHIFVHRIKSKQKNGSTEEKHHTGLRWHHSLFIWIYIYGFKQVDHSLIGGQVNILAKQVKKKSTGPMCQQKKTEIVFEFWQPPTKIAICLIK